jgi:hypothetical protein
MLEIHESAKISVNDPIQSTGEALNESAPVYGCSCDDLDLSLLQESLRLTPWERMLANDDALNFGETLRAAMKQRDAKP